MAKAHGKDTYMAVSDSAGTLRRLDGVDSVSGLPGAGSLSEVTAFADAGEKFIRGMEAGQFSISGSWDNAASTGNATVLNGIRTLSTVSTFEYGPEGNTTGKVKYSGSCWLESFTVDASAKEKVPFSAQFRVDGAVTVGTFA